MPRDLNQTDPLARLKRMLESVRHWSEWPDEGDLGSIEVAIAEIEQLRNRLQTVEVTEEMAEAGAYVLAEYDVDLESLHEGATRIFTAMLNARRPAKS